MSQTWTEQAALNMAGAQLLRETVLQVKGRQLRASHDKGAQCLSRKLAVLQTLNDGQRKTPLNGAVTPSGASKSAFEGLI
ncbi:TPA: hypothetical protein ACGD2I_003512 [Aeromonas hydrophila]|uniref:hypothetical protein n=1 Tax=Aeromonas hydrophila TaxID=644 RepID=UPI000FD162FA|nr:hypothetical protein [Aeromonas hydrophila]AZU48472.1 hypothetical protein C3B79_2715 [Aeromonas hydrophila]MCV3294449.1 hypothetical protein [Aeromonas hydrophila]QBX71012.1 hypothetical protein E4625_09310 [Aeromonas hydrophila]QBX75738.1 hypothetical protein E4630_09240 [Aeromonas hydrophila]WDA26149.1 hypothetical protein PSC74_07340 [Aeromonas hydrophila]